MRAGRLRNRITIEENTPTQGDSGELVPKWSEFATRWARVVTRSGRERFADDAKFAEADVRFELRHIDGVTPEMRVVYDGREFDIEAAVNVNERDRETHIVATERTD